MAFIRFALPAPPAASASQAVSCLRTFTLRRHGKIVIRRTLCNSKGLQKRPARLPFGGGQRKNEVLLEDLQRRNVILEKEERHQCDAEKLKLESLLETKQKKDASNEIDELKANLQNVQWLLEESERKAKSMHSDMESGEMKLDLAQKRIVVQDIEIAQLKARLQDCQKAEEHARDARRAHFAALDSEAEDVELAKTLEEKLERQQRQAVSDFQFLKARLQEQIRLKEAAECQARTLLLAMGKNTDGSSEKVLLGLGFRNASR